MMRSFSLFPGIVTLLAVSFVVPVLATEPLSLVRDNTVAIFRITPSEMNLPGFVRHLEKLTGQKLDMLTDDEEAKFTKLRELCESQGVERIDIVISSPTQGNNGSYAVLRRGNNPISDVDVELIARTTRDSIGINREPLSSATVAENGHVLLGLPKTITEAIEGNVELGESFAEAFNGVDAPVTVAVTMSPAQRKAFKQSIPPSLPGDMTDSLRSLIDDVSWLRLHVTPTKLSTLQLVIGTRSGERTEASLQNIMKFMNLQSGDGLPTLVFQLLQTLKIEKSKNMVTVKLKDERAAREVALALTSMVDAARSSSVRVVTQNNFKQVGLGLHLFHDKYGGFPPVASFSEQGKPMLSWRVYLLPMIDEQELFEKFHLDEPWNSAHNRKLIAEIPKVFQDPDEKVAPGKTRIQAIVGKEMAFTGDKLGVAMRTFTDGTSATLMAVEVAPSKAVEWTRPVDFEVGAKLKHPNGNEGFIALVGDGSVRYIEATIDLDMLRRMMTRGEGTPVEQ